MPKPNPHTRVYGPPPYKVWGYPVFQEFGYADYASTTLINSNELGQVRDDF